MGLHTWFHKNGTLYQREMGLWKQLDNSDDGIEYVDEFDYRRILNEAEQIHEENEADYHDCFRTGKREPDGSYTEDVIYSKEHCDAWLEQNTHFGLNRDLLDRFWEEYPEGVIDFG